MKHSSYFLFSVCSQVFGPIVTMLSPSKHLFHPNRALRVTHVLDSEAYIMDLPIFEDFDMNLSEEERETIFNQTLKHMKWFEENGILTEENTEPLLKLSLCTPPPQSSLITKWLASSTPAEMKEKIAELKDKIPEKIEIMTSWALLLTLIDDHFDNDNQSKESLSKDTFKIFGTTVVSFLESVLHGEYKEASELPEFIIEQYPKIYLPVKGILLRVNELKAIDPNYKNTMRYALDTIMQGTQSVFLLVMEEQNPNLPITLYDELAYINSGGSISIEIGILLFEYVYGESFPKYIRNHILYNHIKNIIGSAWAKINSLIGLGLDIDRNEIRQSPILFRHQKLNNRKTLREVVLEEEKDLKIVLTEIQTVCVLFQEGFPKNREVEFITLVAKLSCGIALRASYLAGRYDINHNRKSGTTTQIEFVNTQSGEFIPKLNLLDLYNSYTRQRQV